MVLLLRRLTEKRSNHLMSMILWMKMLNHKLQKIQYPPNSNYDSSNWNNNNYIDSSNNNKKECNRHTRVSKGIIHLSISLVSVEGQGVGYCLENRLNNKNSGIYKRKRRPKGAKGQIITPCGPWAGVRWPSPPEEQFQWTKNTNNSSNSGINGSNDKEPEASRPTKGTQMTYAVDPLKEEIILKRCMASQAQNLASIHINTNLNSLKRRVRAICNQAHSQNNIWLWMISKIPFVNNNNSPLSHLNNHHSHHWKKNINNCNK